MRSLGTTTLSFCGERQERSVELWRRYAFLIAVIVLLAAEWFLRKRNGMV